MIWLACICTWTLDFTDIQSERSWWFHFTSSGFKKSIQFSPSPFNPDKRPEQGILKTPDGSSQETPDGTPSASSWKITRQPTPHVKTRGVKRTPSSVKKLRTPTSVQKYTGTPIPNKAAPVMRLVKSPSRAKAADYF